MNVYCMRTASCEVTNLQNAEGGRDSLDAALLCLLRLAYNVLHLH